MTNSNFNHPVNGISLSSENISLTTEQINWAIHLSNTAPASDGSDDRQWHLYLNALALQGVKQWFERQSPNLSLRNPWLPNDRQTSSSILFRSVNETINTLEVGDFKLYLMALDDLKETIISVPKSIVDRSDHHFYMLVEVLEELAEVRVAAYLRCDRLRESVPLEADADTYLLPRKWFDPNSNQLLLYLQFVEPAALMPQLALTAPFIQHSINVALWLRNQIDQVAQELAWVVLPPTSVLAMRSRRSADTLDTVIAELIARQQIEVPPQVGHAYQEVDLGETTVRLYAVVWQVETADRADWMLLLILTTPTGTSLPAGLQLRVCDNTQLLADRTPEKNRDRYLYAQVRGKQDENFYVTLSLETAEMTLPPFEFNLST